jgi:hypothetical protein
MHIYLFVELFMTNRDVKILELESELGRAVEKLWGDVRRLETENAGLREQRDLLEARLHGSEDAFASFKLSYPRRSLSEASTQTEYLTCCDRSVSTGEAAPEVQTEIAKWKQEAIEILELQRETVKALQSKYRRVLLFADELQRKLKPSVDSK